MTLDDVKELLREKVRTNSEEDFEVLFDVVKSLYFQEGRFIPISVKSLSLISSNITQRQVAEYLYAIFVKNTDLKDRFGDMAEAEDSNALEKCLYESFEDSQVEVKENASKGRCYIPYIRDVFIKDFGVLMSNPDEYKGMFSVC